MKAMLIQALETNATVVRNLDLKKSLLLFNLKYQWPDYKSRFCRVALLKHLTSSHM